MPNSKQMELERQALLHDMPGKIDFMFQLLSQATIQNEDKVEKKSERKTRKKTKKTE